MITLAVLGCLLSGCSTRSTDDEGVTTFVTEVRRAVPETTSYSYDTLGNIAQFACDLGDRAAVVEALENFTDIRAEDRATVARLALTYACR